MEPGLSVPQLQDVPWALLQVMDRKQFLKTSEHLLPTAQLLKHLRKEKAVPVGRKRCWDIFFHFYHGCHNGFLCHCCV